MVTSRRVLWVLQALLLIVMFSASACQQSVWAADIQFHLEKQWVKIWINTDGTIDLEYALHIVCDQGSFSYVTFDQPNGDFKIGEALDSDGHALRIEDATQGTDYKVKVFLYKPLAAGQGAQFTATTNVGHMIWEDTTNPGNAGLQFIPTSWNAVILDLRVLVVLPAGVSKEQIRVSPDWDNAYTDPNEQGRLVVYWERKDVAPNTKFQAGISFPKSYVEHYETTKPTGGLSELAVGMLGSLLVLFVIVIVAVGVRRAARRSYADPKMQMETLGIRRGFTAVEASYLLDVSPIKVIVMTLYSLLLKRVAWVTSAKPSLRLQISEGFKDTGGEPSATELRYYERDFLNAVMTDGTLDERKLAGTFMQIRSSVENSLRGYCRADTIAFYRKTVQSAWDQVEKAGTPDLASKIFDENLLWLMLDDDFRSRSEDAFREIDFQPLPYWWWYWYGYTQYHPNPAYDPATRQGQPPPKIPGTEFANNIATSLERTAGHIVVNIEKFTNSILPAPPPSQDTSRQPVRHGTSCACACVSCACVCACVSCACACASGGGVG